MRKALIAFIIVLVIAAAYGVRRAYFQDRQSNPVNPGPERVFPVEVITVKTTPIWEKTEAIGTVKANSEVVVLAKATGTVEKVFHDVGDWVKSGGRLAQVDDTLLRWGVDEARARLAEVRSNLEKMRSLTLPEELRTKRAMADSALARYSNAKSEYERMGRLFAEGIIARERLEAAEMALKVSEAEYKAAKEQLALVEYGARREDLEMAEARVNQAGTSLANAEKRLLDTIVESPMEGIISEKMVETGSGTVAGAVLFKIIDIKKVKTLIEVPARDISRVQLGSQAKVAVDPFPDREFQGKVSNIHPQAYATSRTIPVEIGVGNADLLLRPGMTARVVITGSYLGHMVVLPREALLDEGHDPHIFVVSAGKAFKRRVTPGARLQEGIAIASGLASGEQVVVVGQDNLSNGVRVEVGGGRR